MAKRNDTEMQEQAEQPPGSEPAEIPAAEPAEDAPPEAETPAPDEPAQQPSATAAVASTEAARSEKRRGRRQERRGVVVSDAMEKTIVVKVDTIKAHRKYKKVVRRSTKFHAHDEGNAAKVGDIVRIVETRPVSATKRWRLVEIVEAAK